MDEKEFWNDYYYSPLDQITVVNPLGEDFVFRSTINVGVDVITGKMKDATREYVVKAGASRVFPGTVANMYLDQMFKKLLQDEENSFIKENPTAKNTPESGVHISQLSDYAIRKKYYDKLVVGKTNTIETTVEFSSELTGENLEKDTNIEEAFASLKDGDEAGTNAGTATRKAGSRAQAVANAQDQA